VDVDDDDVLAPARCVPMTTRCAARLSFKARAIKEFALSFHSLTLFQSNKPS